MWLALILFILIICPSFQNVPTRDGLFKWQAKEVYLLDYNISNMQRSGTYLARKNRLLLRRTAAHYFALRSHTF